MNKPFVIDQAAAAELDLAANSYRAEPQHTGEHSMFQGSRPDPNIVKLVYEVFLRSAATRLQPVVFAGIEAGAVCSSTTAAAATLLAQSTGTVCLIEANLSCPTLSTYFAMDDEVGLTDALNARESARAFSRQVGESRLWVLPAGKQRSTAPLLLIQEELTALVTELNQEFDFVLIDSIPLSDPEALSIARLASGVVLVLDAGKTRRNAAAAAAKTLRSMNVPVLAAVLDESTSPAPDSIWARF
jgi:Mrp family chromosome partitioning ATPase